MAEPLVRIEAVSKSYGPDFPPVLDRVSLELGRGEFVALMGASGSGKTTLLNLAGGLDLPDRGVVRIAGTDLAGLDDDARSDFRLRRLGFVFQFFNLLPTLTVGENIALPLLFLGEPERRARAAAAGAADEVGLGGKTDRPVHQLSGGEMQRVAIARALVHAPDLLLADEPTGNLDSRTGAVILDLIAATAARHALTVLMATHDPRAAQAAHRVVRMADGRVVGEGLEP